MISIINAIKSLFVGDKSVKSVSIGNTQVYPNGIVTYNIVTIPAVEYSSGGSYIPASGDGYAKITATLVKYVDNVEQSREVIEFTPTLVTSGVDNIWSVSGTHIIAANRGAGTGDSRNASFRISYENSDGFSFTDNSTNYVITQQENRNLGQSAGYIQAFTIVSSDGIASVGTSPTTGGTEVSTLSLNSVAQTLQIPYKSVYRKQTYTSGYTAYPAAPSSEISVTSSQSWITINGSTATVSENNTSGSRTATVTIKDITFPSVVKSITIDQNNIDWVLSSGLKNIAYSDTSFYIDIVSTKNGEIFTTNMGLGVSITNNSIGNLAFSRQEVLNASTGSIRLHFTCSQNSGTSNLSGTILLTQPGGLSKTWSITQYYNGDAAISGINIRGASGDWVIGLAVTGTSTYTPEGGTTTTYESRAVVIAKRSPITSDATVSIGTFGWQWQPHPTVAPTSYSETDIQQTISAGTTWKNNNTGITYYGTILKSPALSNTAINRPLVQINLLQNFSVQ